MHRFKLLGFIGAVLAALALAGESSARPPFGSPDPDRDPGTFIEENAEALDLDDETLAAIRSIVAESKGEGDQFHTELRELHDQMKTLLSQDSPDESVVMKQIETIGAVETEMQKHRLGTMLEIRALLSPEQREEMTRLRDESRGRWRRALRDACEADLEAWCPDADDRWSRKQCLRDQREKVSDECRDAIEAARHAHRGPHEGGPRHRGAGCPMHQGVDCPIHKGADCPLQRGADGSEKPEVSDTY
jgi:Spy/CpxP family protein refolding chaperone